jgi:hypothetical protein
MQLAAAPAGRHKDQEPPRGHDGYDDRGLTFPDFLCAAAPFGRLGFAGSPSGRLTLSSTTNGLANQGTRTPQ